MSFFCARRMMTDRRDAANKQIVKLESQQVVKKVHLLLVSMIKKIQQIINDEENNECRRYRVSR